MIVIAGAGLAGLSCARALPKGSYRICEAAPEPGGLCRSIRRDGYTFDYTGHLLHLKGDMLAFVESLLGDNLAVITRRAKVHMLGKTFDYPFQMNIPDEIRGECLEEFEKIVGGEIDETNFARWSESVFGAGITKYFMRPYNEKLLRRKMEELSAEWVKYVPRPDPDQVRGRATGTIGYNAEFRYPKHGGIGALVSALADGINVELSSPVTAVANRRVRIGDEWTEYDRLISTIPLPELIRMTLDAPAGIRAAAEDLEAVGVFCLNLGIDGATSDAHWIYYPEEEFPFFRVGFYHNIAPSSAPRGKSALYVETSYRSRDEIDEDRIIAALGYDPARIEVRVPVWIDSAYAIHTLRRARALEMINPWLESIGVVPIGRYGRWAYTSMGDALEEGINAAKSIRT